jgi:hypothetical protein
MSGLCWVIVGASGSPGNLCTLRYAEHLARATGDAGLITYLMNDGAGGVIVLARCA